MRARGLRRRVTHDCRLRGRIMMCGTYMAFGALLIANCCQRTRQQQAARLTSSIRRFQTPIANPRGLLAPQPPPPHTDPATAPHLHPHHHSTTTRRRRTRSPIDGAISHAEQRSSSSSSGVWGCDPTFHHMSRVTDSMMSHHLCGRRVVVVVCCPGLSSSHTHRQA